MENKDNRHIDDFFTENEGEKSPENLRENQDRSNYFNDFGSWKNSQTSYSPSQNDNQTKNETQTKSELNEQKSAQKGYYEPEQNRGIENVQRPNFVATDGLQNVNKATDINKFFALGVVSTVFGITSIFASILMGIAIVLAIMGLVLSIVRMSVKADGFSIVGLITSTIGFLLNALFLIAFIFTMLNPTESAVVLRAITLL